MIYMYNVHVLYKMYMILLGISVVAKCFAILTLSSVQRVSRLERFHWSGYTCTCTRTHVHVYIMYAYVYNVCTMYMCFTHLVAMTTVAS